MKEGKTNEREGAAPEWKKGNLIVRRLHMVLWLFGWQLAG